MIFIGLTAFKIEICTVFGCEKPSIYAGLRLITITLLRPSKGYKKDEAQETPDFIGGFAVSTAEKTASDFVDVKKILFPF